MGLPNVAYFSMEIAIDQSIATYSGGLGFLAGSHIQSKIPNVESASGLHIQGSNSGLSTLHAESINTDESNDKPMFLRIFL